MSQEFSCSGLSCPFRFDSYLAAYEHIKTCALLHPVAQQDRPYPVEVAESGGTARTMDTLGHRSLAHFKNQLEGLLEEINAASANKKKKEKDTRENTKAHTAKDQEIARLKASLETKETELQATKEELKKLQLQLTVPQTGLRSLDLD